MQNCQEAAAGELGVGVGRARRVDADTTAP
jgi:hypothetical protein